MTSLAFPTYASLGVRPLINCRGTLTIYGGSLMLPQVRLAMQEASKAYVNLDELMAHVGSRIADLMGSEAALVTNGCAAALCQVTAACVAGADAENIKRLPDTTGMKNEVITLASHRHVYDHAIRMVGVRLVQVADAASMAAAFNERTALVAVFGDRAGNSEMTVSEIVALAHGNNVPVLVDAAAERPDSPDRYLADGVDAVAYSGGKCLRGPQSSGLVLGRKDILAAAFMNGAPHHSIGRPMKASKEEIMGLLAAVEQWEKRDHAAEWTQWEGYLNTVADAVAALPSIETFIRQPGRSNVMPTMEIRWDQQHIKIAPKQVERQLSDGEPRIEMSSGEQGVQMLPYMMEPGEAAIVAERLSAILRSAAA